MPQAVLLTQERGLPPAEISPGPAPALESMAGAGRPSPEATAGQEPVGGVSEGPDLESDDLGGGDLEVGALEAEGLEVEEPADPSLRRCIAAMTVLPVAQTLRFVIGPDGQVLPDLARKLPGRGLHVTASRALLDRAIAKRCFSRVARRPVQVDAGLPDLVERLLAQRLIETLGLARRAGQAVAGHDKVLEQARRHALGLLVQAADGSADEKTKLARSLARVCPQVCDGPLTAEELGQAFARDRAVHVGVARGRLAEQVGMDMARLAGFRAAVGDDGR